MFCGQIHAPATLPNYIHVLQIINKIMNYFIVLTTRTAAQSFFQNPTLDLESNPHAILIRI